jgi:hypothetical protein
MPVVFSRGDEDAKSCSMRRVVDLAIRPIRDALAADVCCQTPGKRADARRARHDGAHLHLVLP